MKEMLTRELSFRQGFHKKKQLYKVKKNLAKQRGLYSVSITHFEWRYNLYRKATFLAIALSNA